MSKKAVQDSAHFTNIIGGITRESDTVEFIEQINCLRLIDRIKNDPQL